MLEVTTLTKKYGKVLAVDSISFTVNPGEIGVLLGPNGAGKSTTIKSIAGLLRFEGTISICELDNKSIDAKKVFGYVPETPALYDALTVYEHLVFIAKAYDLDEGWQEEADRLMSIFDLTDKKDKVGKDLSKGMCQKVSLCCALLIKPKVIMLDEPMIGLDPKAIKELKKILLQLKSDGCSVLISTHIIDSIEDLWDKVLILHKGKFAAVRTRSEVNKSHESIEQLFFNVTEEGE